LPDTFNEALHNVMNGIALDLRNKLIDKSPVHDGQLRNSIQIEVTDDAINIRMADYAPYVEFGTAGQKAGKTSTVDGETVTIPANPNRKMPMSKSNGKWTSYLDKWAKDTFGAKNGFALAKHIQMYGTDPHPFIRPVLYMEVEDAIRDNWNRHMKEVIIG